MIKSIGDNKMTNKWNDWRENWMNDCKAYAEAAIKAGISCDEALAKFEETITFPTKTSIQSKEAALILAQTTIEFVYLTN